MNDNIMVLETQNTSN